MQKLMLADDLMPAVLDGTKRVTIRKGRRDVVPGPMLLEATNGTVPAINVRVLRVEVTKLEDVSEWALAGEDTDLVGLFNALVRFYPDITPESEVTSIEFTAK